jgi:hypothetical protein
MQAGIEYFFTMQNLIVVKGVEQTNGLPIVHSVRLTR